MREPQDPTVDTRVVVETPEGVDFRFVIAGPGKRAGAFLTDLVLKIAITIGFGFLASSLSLFGDVTRGMAAGMFLVTLFVVNWFYAGLFEGFGQGQTPGKRLARLRVVRTNGTPISVMNALGRNFLTAADCQPPLMFMGTWTVGLLTMFSNRRLQRLGDLVFDTMVIDESREWVTRAPGGTVGLDPIPRSECSGRYSVPERTLALIERLFEEDRAISDGRREEIARPVSLALRHRLGWEEAGPDPANPHVYFTQAPNRHTVFLRRILKTFSDDPRLKEENSRTLASVDQRRYRPVRTAPQGGEPAPAATGDRFRGAEGTLDTMRIEWAPVADPSAAVANDSSEASRVETESS